MDTKDLKAFYEKVKEIPYFLGYLTMQDKFIEMCNDIRAKKVDITKDDKSFDNIMKFNEKAPKMLEDMEKMWGKIDSSKQVELRASQREAGEASLESMYKKFRE
jgi:hypothetical protein